MKAITVKQPWASAIASGMKTVENRTRPHPWNKAIGQRIAIHAGQTWDRTADGYRPPLLTVWEADLRNRWKNSYPTAALLTYTIPGSLPQGFILATATLSSIHVCDGGCSEWAQPGQHHLTLTDIVTLQEPIAAKGQLGLWDWHSSAYPPTIPNP